MTAKEHWDQNYKTVMDFMTKNHRRPSKHRLEEHAMLYWIKYNKRLLAIGKLPDDRIKRFNHVLAVAGKYRRINQHSYVSPNVGVKQKSATSPPQTQLSLTFQD